MAGPAPFIYFALTIVLAATTVHAGAAERRRSGSSGELLLRSAIHRELDVVEWEYWGELRYVSRRFDFNGDGRKEVIVWVPTPGLGGTSGYPLLIFSKHKRGYRLLWSFEQAWTPLIVLNSSRHRWRDIVFVMGGGGERMRFVLVRHNGKSYSHNVRAIKAGRIRGRRLMEKGWLMSVMGPLPQ